METAAGTDMPLSIALAANLHDVKNLMGQLMLRLDALTCVDPGVREARFLCQQVNDRMVQMLLMYEVEDGTLLPTIEAHNPADFLLELRENAKAWVGDGLEIVMLDDQSPDYWYFDRALIEMVMMNALHNAVRHARHRISLGVQVQDGLLAFSVADDGDGYPVGVLQQAGYRRLPVSQDGTGLGLYFAGKIAAAHVNHGVAGRMTLGNVSSGSGALFTILLP